MTENNPGEILAAHVANIKFNIGEAIVAAAHHAGVSREVAHDVFANALRPWLRTQAVITDGRANNWRVRVRLYAADRPNDVIADSDPNSRPDAAGNDVVNGLPAVAELVATLAQAWHGTPCVGLDSATLRHKLKGLRPTLSRRGGNATWRLDYRTAVSAYLARVDIQREES
jgi:hypothetical protein